MWILHTGRPPRGTRSVRAHVTPTEEDAAASGSARTGRSRLFDDNGLVSYNRFVVVGDAIQVSGVGLNADDGVAVVADQVTDCVARGGVHRHRHRADRV